MNSLQCLDQKFLLGITTSCSKAVLDIFTSSPTTLEDTFLSQMPNAFGTFFKVLLPTSIVLLANRSHCLRLLFVTRFSDLGSM